MKKSKEPIKKENQLSKFFSKVFGVDVVIEHKFHQTRRWRFDYAIPELKIAIEQEGGVWSNGRHTRGSGYIGDMEKYNSATLLGWSILRYTPQQLKKTEILGQIQDLIKLKSNDKTEKENM